MSKLCQFSGAMWLSSYPYPLIVGPGSHPGAPEARHERAASIVIWLNGHGHEAH